MKNTRMPLVIGISPSKNERLAHRAFHPAAETTKRISRLLYGDDKHVAELENHMHLVNLDDQVVLGDDEIPIALCTDKRLPAVPREPESFATLNQLYLGGMLQDRIIILLGDRVAKRFFGWIEEEVPELFSTTHIVHQHGNWDCAAVYVPHPTYLKYHPEDRVPFVDLMCDALGFTDGGEVSDTDDCLDSSGRKAIMAAWEDDYDERERINAYLNAQDDDDDGIDPEDWAKQMRLERRALLLHYRRPLYSDDDCLD